MISELLFLTGLALGIALVSAPFAYYYALETRARGCSRRGKDTTAHEGKP